MSTVYTPIKFEVVARPDDTPRRPGRGTGKSPLTEAILATLGTDKAVRVDLEDRSFHSTCNRLRTNLRRYHVSLRIRQNHTEPTVIFVHAVPLNTSRADTPLSHTTTERDDSLDEVRNDPYQHNKG